MIITLKFFYLKYYYFQFSFSLKIYFHAAKITHNTESVPLHVVSENNFLRRT